jgi:bifunctional non-homologous end joining protein LigD
MSRVIKAFGLAGPQIRSVAARCSSPIDNGRVQILTRTGLDWTAKYPSIIAALSKLNAKTAYIDCE